MQEDYRKFADYLCLKFCEMVQDDAGWEALTEPRSMLLAEDDASMGFGEPVQVRVTAMAPACQNILCLQLHS